MRSYVNNRDSIDFYLRSYYKQDFPKILDIVGSPSNHYTLLPGVDEKYVYYVVDESQKLIDRPLKLNSKLLRAEKTDGTYDKRFELLASGVYNSESATFQNLKVLNVEPQEVRKDHPCKIGKRGCKDLCFAIPYGKSTKLTKKCVDAG